MPKLGEEFHAKQNWYFSRLKDGTVKIRRYEASPNWKSERMTLLLSRSEWASIVAFVSQYGDTREAWEKAKEFHG